MPPAAPNPHFRAARRALFALVPLLLAIAGWQWLQNHPQHNPWAPLNLNHPPGWATRTKLARLKEDVGACRAVLARSEVAFTALDAAGEGECARPDRTRLRDYPLSPDTPPVTCPVAIALELWRRDSLAPAARQILGSDIARIEHLGAFSCRRMYARARAAGASTPPATPSTSPASCWRTAGGSACSATGTRTAPKPASCGRCATAPARASPPCSRPITMRPTRTTSISIRTGAGAGCAVRPGQAKFTKLTL